MSLRLRSLLLLGAVVIPSLLAAIWAVISTYQREKDETQRSLRATTRALALVVDRELGRRESIAWTLAASPAAVSGDMKALHDQAVPAVRGVGGWTVLFDRQRQLLNTHLPLGSPLHRQPEAYGRLIDKLQGDRAHVTGLIKGPLTGQQLVMVQVPVRQPGEPVQAPAERSLGVVMLPERLLSLLTEQRLPPGWIAAVLDQNGVVVARSPDHQTWVGQSGTKDMLRRLRLGSEGAFESVSLDGTSTAAFFSKSPRYGWAFVIAVPRHVAQASMHQAMMKVGLAGLVLVLLSGAVAIIAVRSILQPMQRLQRSAEALEAGVPVNYEPVGLKEFDALGHALQSASASLLASQEVLQRRVDQAVEDTRRAEQALSASRRLEAVGRLTGGVAHDVNNLLGVVANNVALLKRLPPDQHAPRIAAIGRSIDNGKRLTQKLLAFARRRVSSPAVLDLRAWLPSSLPILNTSVRTNVHLSVQAGERAVPVEVDATDLEVALVNLAVNASDALPEGGTIDIALRRTHDHLGAEWAEVSVSDAGHGMSPEVLSQVFEPFFTTKDESRGAGLGLSQVHGFCRQSGGDTLIESRPGEGTTVTMRLPVSSRALPGILSPAPLPAVQGKRILYVEDNLELAETTSLMLTNLGYTLHWASNGEAALARADLESFDLLLTDIVMPGAVNGLALARAVHHRVPSMPVVLMTGYSREADEAVSAGFKVLSKPCLPDELATALLQALA
ncbi:MAG: response regulator [Rubrivivax sp.]|nr:MAG: response regulator [Rubrivivax sp.]